MNLIERPHGSWGGTMKEELQAEMDDKGAKLMSTLYERGWKINGNMCRFTAVYKDLTLFYDKGGIKVCYSDGTEIMRLSADDLMR